MVAATQLDGDRIPSTYLADLPAAISTLRRAWEGYQLGNEPPALIRGVIAESWERSAERRVPPERRAAELDRAALRGFQSLDTVQRAFRQASTPVVADLERELSSTNSAIVVCDEFGAILDRGGDRTILRRTERQNFVPGAMWSELSAGTNGIGLALALGRPAQVLGGEHFCMGFQEYACTAAPVRHPVTRAVVGLLDVTSDAREASPLAYALVVQAAGAIERQMEEQVFGRERSLMERYLRGRVALRSPLLTVDRAGRTIIQNAPAAEQLAPEDVRAVLRLARDALRSGRDAAERLQLTCGAARVDVHLAREGAELIGAVIAVAPAARAERRAPAGPVSGGAARDRWGGLVGASPAMRALFRHAERIAAGRGPLVIEGEPGTGKLALARAIHERAAGASARRPLAVVRCSQPGWRRAWHSALAGEAGTIALRRLGAVSAADQLALADELDDLDGRDRAPRVIGLLTDDEAGVRLELLHRLAHARLAVPPLRARGADVDLLVNDWLARRRADDGVPPVVADAARDVLRAYAWPGNVRELFVVLDAAALRHPGLIRPQDLALPTPEAARADRPAPLRAVEREAIARALEESGGNVTRAAGLLGISRTTLHRRLRAYRALGEQA